MASASASPDPESRRCLARLFRRAGWYAAYATFLWLLLTSRTPAELAAMLQITCTGGALAAFLFARRFGERIGGPSLNHWDEGAALYCAGLGAHIIARALA